jgi:DNA-binding transcriptional LysR family regulator
MNIDLELYKVFYTVACYKSISKAAEALYISQPAISKSIMKIENDMGVILFSRNSRGVKLTEEGKVLFEYIQKAMNEISIGERLLTKLKKKEEGTIKLGVSTTLCRYFLIPILKGFIEQYPHIQIKIINKTTLETLELLDEGKIDLGLVSCAPYCESYSITELLEIQDVFVCGKEYLETKGITEATDIFSKSNLMLLEEDNISRKYIDQYFTQNNIEVKPDIQISNMDLLIEFAKIGLGVTCVIKDFIRKELAEGSLVEIPITPSIPKRTIDIVYNKKLSLSIAAQTLQDFIEQSIRK